MTHCYVQYSMLVYLQTQASIYSMVVWSKKKKKKDVKYPFTTSLPKKYRYLNKIFCLSVSGVLSSTTDFPKIFCQIQKIIFAVAFHYMREIKKFPEVVLLCIFLKCTFSKFHTKRWNFAEILLIFTIQAIDECCLHELLFSINWGVSDDTLLCSV